MAIRRKLKMAAAEPEAPNSITVSVSDEVHGRLMDLWEPDESLDSVLIELFEVDWNPT